jgi:hypothetical protein
VGDWKVLLTKDHFVQRNVRLRKLFQVDVVEVTRGRESGGFKEGTS